MCCAVSLALFQYGFSQTPQVAPETVSPPVPSHIPEPGESPELSVEEHARVADAVSGLADPAVLSNKRKSRGKYSVYNDEVRARIGKYALLNGNERARQKFRSSYLISQIFQRVQFETLRKCI